MLANPINPSRGLIGTISTFLMFIVFRVVTFINFHKQSKKIINLMLGLVIGPNLGILSLR